MTKSSSDLSNSDQANPVDRPVQAELWSTEAPLSPARFTPSPSLVSSLVPSLVPSPHVPSPHVSMPLGDYVVHRLPGAVPPDGEDATVTREHIACKQPLKPTPAALVDVLVN